MVAEKDAGETSGPTPDACDDAVLNDSYDEKTAPKEKEQKIDKKGKEDRKKPTKTSSSRCVTSCNMGNEH